LTLDVSKVTTEEVTFVVEKDISRAQAAVDTFIEEFNDAQKYVNSLVAVTRDGDSVTAGRFSGSLEISRLGSALRKIVFGDNYPHSASESTSDGTNKTVGDLDSRNLLSFDADNDGYRIYVEDPTSGAAGGYSGTSNYQEWSWSGASGDWVDFTPTYSAFRVNDVGLDFRSGSDEIYLKDSALLIQELTDNPNKVKALFAEEKPDTAELDLNTGQNREYGGLTYFLSDYIENFVESDSGTYLTHIASLRNQNERIETNIDDLERYLVQREESLSQSFIRMEEMQSRMSTQLQTLQNSFKK
jgi:flagellar capping protein FliD